MALRDGEKIIVDAATDALVHDGTAIVASGASSDVFDCGGAAIRAELYLDVTAVDVTSGDELYQIFVECGDAVGFGGDIIRTGYIELGDSTVVIGGVDKTTGVYAVPFTNTLNGVAYPFVRLYVEVGVSTTPSITMTATMGKQI